MNTTYIKTALFNLSIYENDNKRVTVEQKKYYRGLIVGIVSALMDQMPFLEALQVVKNNLPEETVNLHDVLPDWF